MIKMGVNKMRKKKELVMLMKRTGMMEIMQNTLRNSKKIIKKRKLLIIKRNLSPSNVPLVWM